VTLPALTVAAARIKVEAVGNVFFDVSDASFPIESDTTAPQTTITSGPAGPTNDTTPTFEFSSEPDATFECKIASADFEACTSPHTTDPLADGTYTFEVRASDLAGNTDATPASRTLQVDTVAPVVSFHSGPAGPTADSTPTFAFSSEPGATFSCELDVYVFPSCPSPFTTEALDPGAHTITVRATDPAGNVGPETTRSFTVAPLQTVLLRGTIRGRAATFRFSGSGGTAPRTFQCRLTGAPTTAAQRAWRACSSPKAYRNLKRGRYTFSVRARDAKGFVDTSPAGMIFRIR
jgi:hypothetical protein